MNNEIGQFILKTYTDLRTSFARAKFKYSCVAFFTILRKSFKCLAILHEFLGITSVPGPSVPGLG